MDYYALCHIGAEQALVRELESLGIVAQPLIGAASFTADDLTVAKALYRLQCAKRLLVAIDRAPWEELDLSGAHALIAEDETFRVSCDTVAGGPIDDSPDIAATLGGQVDRKVDLTGPDKTIYVQAGPEAIAGIDVAGDLSKRYYRVFTSRTSMKGTFAASLLWLFDLHGGLLDPFGNTGEVTIEHALRASNTSPLRFEKHRRLAFLDEHKQEAFVDDERDPEHGIWCFDPHLASLRSCKKNAKLAGVDKRITFSKLDPEWMDYKFDENAVQSIVTIPPPITKRNDDEAHLRELCYQAEFVLSEDGSLVVACLTPETAEALARYAKTYKLSRKEEAVVYAGQLAVQVVRYGL